jgi:hypothetical protein
VSEPAGYYVYWTFYADYPGYVVVTIHTSTTTNNYVEVIWSAYGINYDQRVSLSPGKRRLPGSARKRRDVEIRVGNANLLSGATQTVSIVYTTRPLFSSIEGAPRPACLSPTPPLKRSVTDHKPDISSSFSKIRQGTHQRAKAR